MERGGRDRPPMGGRDAAAIRQWLRTLPRAGSQSAGSAAAARAPVFSDSALAGAVRARRPASRHSRLAARASRGTEAAPVLPPGGRGFWFHIAGDETERGQCVRRHAARSLRRAESLLLFAG